MLYTEGVFSGITIGVILSTVFWLFFIIMPMDINDEPDAPSTPKFHEVENVKFSDMKLIVDVNGKKYYYFSENGNVNKLEKKN